MKKIDATVPMVLLCVTFGLGIVVGFIPVLGLVVFPLAILELVFMCILIHQWWSAVPVEHRSTTPGTAVGFLFIPFFDFYWIFRAIPGLVKCLDRATGSKGPIGVAIAYSVLWVCHWFVSWIPVVGGLMHIAMFVLLVVLIKSITRQANTLLPE